MSKHIHIFLETQGGAPEWIKLLPLGKVTLADDREPFEADRQSLEQVVAEFQGRGIDMVVDYEHQTLTGDRAPAAGWIKELQVRADGLWARVEWTAQAQKYLQEREYRYFSPVLRLDAETRQVTALLHVGLTNNPAINGLPPLVAKNLETLAAAQEAKAAGIQIPEKKEAEAMMEKLKQLLGVKPEEKDEAVLALVDSRLKAGSNLAAGMLELCQVLALKEGATVGEIIGAIKGLKDGQDRLQAVEKELTALKGQWNEREALEAVEEALKAGKILPAEKEHLLEDARRDVAAFKARMEKRPVIGPPVKELPKQPGSDKDAPVDNNALAVCKQLGITPEAFKASREALAQVGQA